MRLNLARIIIAVAGSALVVMPPAAAQAPVPPDCTGISDVSDYDGANVSDFDGQLTTVRVATGLVRPVHVASPPDGPGGPDDRLFIVEQRGTIRILETTTGALLTGFFLDIQATVQDVGNEEGLLSVAFHPEYNTPGDTNEGRFFVYYTNTLGNNQVSRFSVSADPNDADESSEETVIIIDHPTQRNHNGGQIAFGSDGRLYIAPGDGGGGCDPFDAAQNLSDLRGKMLRLDVDTFPPYSTVGNPALGGLGEIWAYGLRNPWRFSFDRETGALYIGDVGQGAWEEINCQPSTSTGGENYGWDLYEGNHCPNPTCGGSAPACNMITNTKNILEYDHARDGFSCSITGGYVYRGCRMTDLHDSYFYADWCSDQVRSFRTDATCAGGSEILRTADLAPGGGLVLDEIASFGEDSRGEIYFCDRGGDIYKLLPELEIMEVSGVNAAPFVAAGGDLVWEDVQASSAQPISSYKVYRADDDASGPFLCAHQDSGTGWLGGDPQNPLPGESFFYLVTALNAAGGETRPGNRFDGTPRTVDTGSICPP